MTDTMGRMHSDAQLTSFSSFSLGKISKFLLHSLVRRFAGSSSVPAHVEMMGFLGIGNNPMVGATVAVAVDVAQGFEK